MDNDEVLVSVASSFINRDLEKSVMFISKESDTYASIVFCIENDTSLLNDKKMINQTDIEVQVDLDNETVKVDTVTKSGSILTDKDGYETQNIWEDRKMEYYMVLTDQSGKYLQCESFVSKTYTVSIDTKYGSRGHSNYEENRLDKNRIDVVDEYSILDGYPVSKALKSFTKVIYKAKNRSV